MINELEATIEKRNEQLVKLLDLTAQQKTAIERGSMSELMRLLAEKSGLAASLVTLSQHLKRDVESSASPPEISTRHRVQHEQCQAMHLELLAREEECEAGLVELRGRLGESLNGGDGTLGDGKIEKVILNNVAVSSDSSRANAAWVTRSRGDRLDLMNEG